MLLNIGTKLNFFKFYGLLLFRASLFFFCASYLYFPKSKILQTGGETLGETSTRSSPDSKAIAIASLTATTPTCPPSASISQTSAASIYSLALGPSLTGGVVIGRLAIELSSSVVNWAKIRLRFYIAFVFATSLLKILNKSIYSVSGGKASYPSLVIASVSARTSCCFHLDVLLRPSLP